MTAEIELAKQHGIQYRMTPEGTTEMWCHDRNVQAFAEAVRAAERERCARLCERQDWPDSESDYLAGCEFAKRIRA